MSEARRWRCPSCGGEVEEGSRSCSYCSAPLATVRCAACFHMNVPDAVHCSGCGRELGLEPIGEPSSLTCPRCETSLQALPQGPGSVFDCAQCGGQFVENALLRELLERQRSVSLGPVRPPPSVRRGDEPVRYLPCPCCQQLMQRKNFGRSSGVIVDICSRHGIWFDAGELPRVLAFVAAGGLERAEARRREEERLAAQRTASLVAPPSLSTTGERGAPLDADLVAGLAEAAKELFEYVRARIR